ncbi:MAG TPA: serine/threonine-protein kinase, partial [Ktedonobacteraceae bacterium]|nr:serine/threonine-protein kinase [Ktedonobacteraceae bacterium]
MRFEGQQIGRYRLSRLLGSGGMGEVYLAEDPRIEQQVAIKIVQGESVYATESLGKEASDLFIREVRVIAKLDHPNILPLYDYGEGEIDSVAVTYIAMPYRREGSLASWLKRQSDKPPVSDDIAPFFLSQAARALQHAHEHFIIHQDVKPSNFLLRERNDSPDHPDLLLADFGIAKFSSASVNMSMTIRGTPTYMAPEQWRGHPVFASDQYALAIMIYQILTGRAPFLGNIEQLMYAHIHHQAATPSILNSRISPAVDAVLLKALAKEPEHRFPSLSAFDAAFNEAWSTTSQQTATWVLPTINFVANTPPIPSPTPPSVPHVQGQQKQELYATLAISQDEALNGAIRTLTLPGGQQIQVPVQPGAQNGQEFRLERRSDAINGGPSEVIVIKLAIIQTHPNLGNIHAAPPTDTPENDQTYLSTNEKTQMATPIRVDVTPSSGSFSPAAATVASGSFSPPAPDTPLPQHQDIPPPLKRWQTLPLAPLRLIILLIVLLLIIGGFIGSFVYINQNNLAHTQATAAVLGGTAVAATATAS